VRNLVPVLDRKVDYSDGAGRQILGERLASMSIAAADQTERELMQAGIVPDDEKSVRILAADGVNDLQQVRGARSIEFR